MSEVRRPEDGVGYNEPGGAGAGGGDDPEGVQETGVVQPPSCVRPQIVADRIWKYDVKVTLT